MKIFIHHTCLNFALSFSFRPLWLHHGPASAMDYSPATLHRDISYKTFSAKQPTVFDSCWHFNPSLIFAVRACNLAPLGLDQGILKGEVSLYCWPPVWLVWNQLYEDWQFLFLFVKQINPYIMGLHSKGALL
jgi:hypothetical protein